MLRCHNLGKDASAMTRANSVRGMTRALSKLLDPQDLVLVSWSALVVVHCILFAIQLVARLLSPVVTLDEVHEVLEIRVSLHSILPIHLDPR